jgi:hypothetical protein
MPEENSPKDSKAFTALLLLALNIIEVVSQVGIVVVWIVAGWAIWKFGWERFHEIFWPTLGICVIFIGSIFGVKLLKRVVN